MNRRDALKLGARSLSALAATAGFSALGSRPARAEDCPAKNVRVIVPYGAGSATDLIPRTIFEAVAGRLGHSFVVENRLGGGTTVGASAVARAGPDGYPTPVPSNVMRPLPAIQPNVPYDPVRDFSGITPLANVPLVLVIAPEKNVKSVRELIALARQKAGAINYAAAGIGPPRHLTAHPFPLAPDFQ